MKATRLTLPAIAAATIGATLLALPASAAYVITQTAAPAPTYDTLLTFDEPGGPTGSVSSTFWTASLGITIGTGVDTSSVPVNDVSGDFPWIDSGNAASGSFGNIIDFSSPVTSVSFQAWGDAGSGGPFGGGFQVAVTDAGGNPIDGLVFTPAWGGIGNTWYNITTTGGSTISHLYLNNNSSIGSPGYIDNLSWSAVPAPGAFALLGLAGVVGSRRRRR